MSKKSGGKHKDQKVMQRSVPLALQYPPDQIVAKAANHMVVQFDKHEYHLSFFQIHPPVILGNIEERLSAVENISEIDATCVGRIIVSSGRIEEFVSALQQVVEAQRQVKPDSETENKDGDGNDFTSEEEREQPASED